MRHELSQACIFSAIPFLLQVITTFPSLFRVKQAVPDHREETEEVPAVSVRAVLYPVVPVFREVKAAVLAVSEVLAPVPKEEREEEQPAA